ncbi:MAG: SUR7/PalI family protein [Planctomycetota bacterium]|jgi:hypothetical protein
MAENIEDKLNALVTRVGKVRRWLVALAILRVAALCLIFITIFTGFYAWLDHRLNFDEVARITAFILLVAGLAFLLHRLTKLLLGHISCSVTANYIENKRSFNQQLVTAIEYYENKQDYPYSKALAEQLVLEVDKESVEFEFDTTVEKWQGYALGAVILLGLVAASFYVRDNYVYFSSYFARLTRPLATVEPLSSTHLESITKDIVAEPDAPVRFAAEIKGRMPQSGKLVLTEIKPDKADDSQEQKLQEMQIQPDLNKGKTAQFEATKSFSEPGKFRYRFETDSTTTEWHKLNISQVPGIESMTAKVTVPRRPPRRKWVKPYTEQIRSNTLEVIPGSSVTLSVKATDKLSKIIATGPDGKTVTRQLNGAEEFTFHFNADKNGSAKFSLVNEQGLANDNIPDLQVIAKTDEPPKFKLVSPDGDYLATNVASIPVTFEVTDDFGLNSVKMCLEIHGRQPKEIMVPVEEGIRSKEFTHTVELEEYELTIGDSVLFYAGAADIDTGSEEANRTSSSDVYFIEIRPYRQNWAPMPGGGESNAGGSPPVELLNILEYTRAILKKTWAIASKSALTEEDRSRLGFINQDVQYCAEQVALIRDDSQIGFEEPHKAVLNEVIRQYKLASRHLASHDAAAAMTPEKSAYRILRKFILELELKWSPPPKGQSPQPKKPDSVKLQKKPEFEGYEKERIEGQLKKMQQKLDKLTREQGELQWSFENFLEQQAEKKAAQQNSDSKPSQSDTEKQDQDSDNTGQQSDSAGQKAESSSSGQGSGGSQDSAQKQDDSAKSQSSGKSAGASGDSDTRQNNTESRESSQSQDSEENKNASDSQSSGNNQDGTGKQSPSNESQSAGKDAGTSGTPDGKQSDTTSRESSQGQSPGDAKSESDSQSSGNSQDGTGKQSPSNESQSTGKGTGTSGTPDGKQSDTTSRESSQGQDSGDAKSESDSQSSGDSTSVDKSGINAQRQGSGQDGSANTESRLRMLQAKQGALQEQVSQLKRELQQLPGSSNSNKDRAQAQQHLDEAAARMDEFQNEMAQARFQGEMNEQRSNEAIALLDSAKSKLDMANKALGRELTLSDDEKLAQQAQDMAEQLTEDADALADSVTDVERDLMLARLEAAKRLLEMMPEPQWSTVNKGSASPSGASSVLTKNPNLPSAEMARQMARRFWSIAINAKKRRQQLLENEPSDVEFYDQENEFFENAARYDQGPVEK